MLKNLLRMVGALLISGVVAVLASPIAAAHVNATLDGAGRPGDFGLITLRVPTESGTAATTKVEVRIPDDVQLRTVLAQPLAGWQIDIKKRPIDPPLYKSDGTPVTEVVSSVTWTATGQGITPGQFSQFALDAGPLPDTETLALPTIQTFSDGKTTEWTQPVTGGDDPKFPAPTVTIGATPAAVSGADSLLPAIAWSALGFSLIAVALGVFAIDRARRLATASLSGAATPSQSSAATEPARAE